MNELLNNKSRPAVRRRRKTAEKPPMPPSLKAEAEKTIKRHARRHRSPGVAVEVEKVSETGYVVGSPHSDPDAWEAMVCDALGTRSVSTAQTFLYQLTELCTQQWHQSEDGQSGEWYPDERELNMILNVVAGIKPKNEMQAALAAQMVAVHLMMMKVAERCLRTFNCGDPHMVAAASKLARTFAIQTEALAKLQGRRTSRQKITVSYEKHEHKHVHVEGGGSGIASQACEPRDCRDGEDRRQAGTHASRSALLGPNSSGIVVPMSRHQEQEPVPNTRRGKRVGRTEGCR